MVNLLLMKPWQLDALLTSRAKDMRYMERGGVVRNWLGIKKPYDGAKGNGRNWCRSRVARCNLCNIILDTESLSWEATKHFERSINQHRQMHAREFGVALCKCGYQDNNCDCLLLAACAMASKQQEVSQVA